MNIIIDSNKVKQLIKHKYGNIGNLASSLNIHRNSISNYLNNRKLLPYCVEQILESLGVNDLDIFLPTKSTNSLKILNLIADLISEIIKLRPKAAIVLFGSRARNKARKYSDIDLGIIDESILSLSELSKLKNLVDEKASDLPYQIDIVDLNRADNDFIEYIINDLQFIGGSPKPYLKLMNSKANK